MHVTEYALLINFRSEKKVLFSDFNCVEKTMISLYGSTEMGRASCGRILKQLPHFRCVQPEWHTTEYWMLLHNNTYVHSGLSTTYLFSIIHHISLIWIFFVFPCTKIAIWDVLRTWQQSNNMWPIPKKLFWRVVTCTQ